MSDHTTDDTGGLHRNFGAHPAPQVHLLVDSMKATGWQAHSVRAFLSAYVGKRLGLPVKSSEREGQRVYAIKK